MVKIVGGSLAKPAGYYIENTMVVGPPQAI
jgi:hypothetical protein